MNKNKHEDVFFVKIEKENAERLRNAHNIKLFPTVAIYKDGRVYEKGKKRSLFKGSSRKTVEFFEKEIEKALNKEIPDGEQI